MQVAAQVAEPRRLQWVRRIQLDTVRFGAGALAKGRGELESVPVADIYQKIYVPAVLGDIRVLLFLEVVVDLWRQRDEISTPQRKGERGSYEGNVERTRVGALLAVRFVLEPALDSKLR